VFVVEYTENGKPLLTENGEIYRDKKVSYIGTTRKVEDFGPMLYQHANVKKKEEIGNFYRDGLCFCKVIISH
jgi:hypothetical protein